MDQPAPRHSRWNGEPARERELFIVRRTRCGRLLHATCELWTHRLGWEVRLVVSDGQAPQFESCRTHQAALDASERWKEALVARGWV